MIIILEQMNIDLSVEEFIALYTRTDLFGTIGHTLEKLEPIVKEEGEINVVPVVVMDKPEEDTIVEDTTKQIIREAGFEPDKDTLVGPEELSKFLGIGYSTVCYYKDKGMPAVAKKKGNKTLYLYDKQACLEWYEQRKKAVKARGKNGSKPKAVYNPNDPNTELSYAAWKAELNRICRRAGKDVGKMLSLTYKYMTKNYGVVWDQEEREFKEANGYRPHSTTQLAHWMETTKPAYHNLTSACLATIVGEGKADDIRQFKPCAEA